MRAIPIILLLAMCSTASAAEYIEVMRNGVRVRAGPTTSAEIVGIVSKGNVFQFYKRSGDWIGIIMFSGDDRYIHSSLVRTTDKVPALPAAGIRKRACTEITKAQQRASAEAQRRFSSHFDMMIDHERLLTDRLELPIFQRYGIAPAHNNKLLTECVTKKWG